MFKWLKDFFDGLGDAVFIEYPSECMICGFDGYTSQVKKHLRTQHAELLKNNSELFKRHKKGELGASEVRRLLKDAYHNE